MTQQIGITIQQQNVSVPLSALLSILADAPVPQATPTLPAEFGEPLQGGIYVGPIWEDGRLVHLIAAPETLPVAECDDAQRIASEYRGPDNALVGYSDWFLPTREHLEIARIYAQSEFEKGYHWSATPYGSFSAWAVVFANGGVHFSSRYDEFRVRPFRRFIP